MAQSEKPPPYTHMSFADTHAARRTSLLLLGGACALLWAGCSADEDSPSFAPTPGGNLGDSALPFPDAGTLLDSGQGPPDDPNRKRLRLMHAIANAGPLQVCHDADRTVGHAPTSPDAAVLGPMPPTLLAELPAFGAVEEVPDLGPLASGALTLHQVLEVADAGVDADAGAGAAPEPCAEDTLEAALLLGSEVTDTDGGVDAGLSALRAGGRVSLFATGVALDATRLEARLTAVRERYLEDHPGDQEGADRAAQNARDALLASVGPQLSESEEPRPPVDLSFRISLSHLVPDVPAPGSSDPGGLRLCVTAGTLVTPVSPPLMTPAVAFRERRVLMGPFMSGLPYRFRVYAASTFDAAGQDCAIASVKPLAELEVESSRFRAGRTYTLAFIGALAPNSLCTPVDPDSLARASCTEPVEALAAKLVVLDD